MLLAIDVGNTHTVFGLWQKDWRAIWRMKTDAGATEDELAAFYFGLCKESPFDCKPESVICANVVPSLSMALELFGTKWLNTKIHFLTNETLPSLKICYEPPSAVGADRLANALGAKAKHSVPAVVVDFGTATTFDAIGANGEYIGGSILPGPQLAMEALFAKAAKLPKVEIVPPKNVIGKDTQSSLQSGLVIGYAGAIDSLAKKMKAELGGNPAVIATGGLAKMFAPLCEEIQVLDENLTLDGLLAAHDALNRRR